jgi:hypothetical protein
VGCGSGGSLQVTKISVAADQPANVAVYVDVKDKLGRPIPGLAEKNFRVYEDGKLVTTSKAKRALLEPKQFDTRYVLLLVDMSGPIVDSEDLPELSNAIAGFVDHVGATHEIAVGAFDGNDEVVPFLGYAGTAETKKVTEALRKFRPRSRNSNLNGAVYQGLHSLRDRLKEASSAQKSAILVVFTDRGELSHSVSPETLKQGLKDTDAQIYVIGCGRGDSPRGADRARPQRHVPVEQSEELQGRLRGDRQEADQRRRRPLRVLVLLAEAQGQSQGGGRGRDAQGPRPRHVQVQRRRLHRRLHPQEADRPRPEDRAGKKKEGEGEEDES